MKSKKLLFLAVVAVVLCGLAYVTSVRRRPGGADVSAMMGKPVLPDLQNTETLNRIGRIVFTSSSATVTVARVDGKWVAPDNYGYPVDFEKVRGFLRKLRELNVGHMLTGGEEQLADLELRAPGADVPDDATGTRVELFTQDGKAIASLIVGKDYLRTPPSDAPPSPHGMGGYPDGRYVRVDQRALLVGDTLQDIPATPRDWMDTQLANLSAGEIEQIMISQGDQSLTLKRPDGGGTLTLPDLADNEEMASTKVNSLANTLSYLTFSDLADPSLSDAEMGFEDPLVFSARNKKNQVYTLTLGASPEGSDTRYARMSASYTPARDTAEPSSPDAADETGAEAQTGEDAQAAAADKAREEAARQAEQVERANEIQEFNTAVQDWTYLVPSHKLTNISVDRSTFVTEKEDEDDDAPDTD